MQHRASVAASFGSRRRGGGRIGGGSVHCRVVCAADATYVQRRGSGRFSSGRWPQRGRRGSTGAPDLRLGFPRAGGGRHQQLAGGSAALQEICRTSAAL